MLLMSPNPKSASSCRTGQRRADACQGGHGKKPLDQYCCKKERSSFGVMSHAASAAAEAENPQATTRAIRDRVDVSIGIPLRSCDQARQISTSEVPARVNIAA